MLLLRLALRNVRRNVQRTGLTALTVLLSTGLLTIGLSWTHGVLGGLVDLLSRFGGHVRVVQPAYANREELLPLYEHLTEVDALAAKVRALPGVHGAHPRITTGVAVAVGDELGDTFAIAVGAPAAWYSDDLHLEEWLVAGRLPVQGREAVIGARLAEIVGAKLGDEVLLVGQTQDGAPAPIEVDVVGIASAGTATVDQSVYLLLEPMQWLADTPGAATELLVYGDEAGVSRALAERLTREPGLAGLTVQPWDGRELAAALVPVARMIEAIFSVVIVSVSALGVWNTMMMSVLERTSEIGVLRAMGLGRRGVVLLFVVEALCIAALGGLGGLLLGGAVGWYLETFGIHMGDHLAQNARMPVRTTMYADLSMSVLMSSFALGLCTALVGTALPAWRAASVQPIEAMRTKG